MTSKNLFFKLMKEDIKSRLWAVALISLGFFFQFPVVSAFQAGIIKEYDSYEIGLRIYTGEVTEWLSFSNGLTVFGMIVIALICGLSSFSYLNSRSKVDFYHSIPVRREKLYLANYLNGILIPAVPYAVFLAVGVMIAISYGVPARLLWSEAAVGFCLHMVHYILMYTTVIIAAMLTGHLVIGFLGSMVLTFYVPMAVTLHQAYVQSFYKTFIAEAAQPAINTFLRISPVIEYAANASDYREKSLILTAAVLLAISAAMAVAGGLLYRMRPSEAAGKAMAFRVTRPVIRILIVVMSALYLGLLFWSLQSSIAWAVFGIVCGSVISHTVIEIIYHFDFKKLFSHKFQLLGCIAVSLAVFAVFRFDVTGYDSYLPKESDVEYGSVQVNVLNDWVSYGQTVREPDGAYGWDVSMTNGEKSQTYMWDHMDYQDVGNLLEIAKAGVDEVRQEKMDRYGSGILNRAAQEIAEENAVNSEVAMIGGADGPTSVFVAGKIAGDTDENQDEENWSVIKIRYTLKNGRSVCRKYNLPLERVWTQMEKVFADENYQKGAFPLMSRTADQVAAVRYKEQDEETCLDRLTEEEKKELLDAYQREFRELTLEKMKKEGVIGLIRFASETDEEGYDWWKKQEETDYSYLNSYDRRHSYVRTMRDKDYYPVYPSFTDTIALLRKHQVDSGARFENRQIDMVSVSRYEEGKGNISVNFTDPEDIRKLKEVMVDTSLQYYNGLYQRADLSVWLNVQNGDTVDSYDAYLPKGKVPEFVTERLEGK